jgi:uncharacterized membrane protein
MSSLEAETRGDEKETGRLEAFSDGIFAVAITLLVLEIRLPSVGQTGLGAWVLSQWPAFVAYFISFMTILIMWINHHEIFKLVHRTDHTFMVINGLLMMVITFVNYPTAVLADAMQKSGPGDSDPIFAAAFYSATFILISIVFQAVWRYATYKRRLLSKHVDPALVATITNQYRFGPVFYLVAFALAFVNVWASVALNGGLAIYFAFTGQATRASGKTHQQRAKDSILQ